jgi:hypothetical protein
MCLGGGPSGGNDAQAAASAAAAAEARRQAEETRQREADRQARIQAGRATIEQTFAPFSDDYYGKQTDNYLAFALPQLNDQYKKAHDGLIFDLARSGNLKSSAGAYRLGELEKEFAKQKQVVADTGANYARSARSDVERARGELVSQLGETGDPDLVGQTAATRANFLQMPQTYSPLGAVFQNVTAAAATAANASPKGEGIGTRLFNSGGSSRVVS